MYAKRWRERLNGNWLLGNGYSSQFSVQINEWKFKTSIENHYLYLLYCSGLIGMSAFILLLSNLYVKSKRVLIEKNSSMYFFRIVMLLFSLCILTVSPKGELNIFFVIIGLLWRNSEIKPLQQKESPNEKGM